MRCQRQHSAIHAGKWGIAGQPEPAACSRCAPFYGGHQSEGCPATGPGKQRLPGSRSTNVTILGTSLSCLPPPVQKSTHSIPADGRPLVLTVSHWDLPWFRQQWHSTAPHRIAHIAAFESGVLSFVSSFRVLTGGWALLSGAFPKGLTLAFALAFTLARAVAARLRDIERHPRIVHRTSCTLPPTATHV